MQTIDRRIVGLALPAVGALAADPLLSAVDTAFVSRLGTTELAALGACTAIFAVAFMVFNFLAYGTTPRIADSLTRDDRTSAHRTVCQAIALAVVLGCAVSLCVWLGAPVFLSWMGVSDDVARLATPYLRIRGLAAPAFLLILAGHGSFRGFHDTRTPMWISLLLNGVNLILDPLLIFDFGLGWRLEGAALASALAQWVGAALFLRALFHRNGLNLTWHRPKPHELIPLLRVGRDTTIRTASLLAFLTVATSIAARIGDVALAAHQVAHQVWLLLALVVDSIAIAAQTLIAETKASAPAELTRVANRHLFWGAILGVLLGAILLVIQRPVLWVLASNAEVIATVSSVYAIIALTQPLNALVFVWDGIFMGKQDFAFLAKAMVFASFGGIGMMLVAVNYSPTLQTIWVSMIFWMMLRIVLMALRHQKASHAAIDLATRSTS